MNKNIKNKEYDIIKYIENIKSTKNPISVLFAITELKEMLISTGEDLLNSIEINYSKESRNEYLTIVDSYKKERIFESIYDYYLNTNNKEISEFRHAIDNYFENSFYSDISFFYYTLCHKSFYHTFFSIVRFFVGREDMIKKYKELSTYLSKKKFISDKYSRFKKITYEEESYVIIRFLDLLSDMDLSVYTHISDKPLDKKNLARLMKNITIDVLSREDMFEFREFILSDFANNENIYKEFIENLEEKYLLDSISFLRKDILSTMGIEEVLDYSTKSYLSEINHRAHHISEFTVDQKVRLLLDKESKIRDLGNNKGELFRITFKKNMMNKENFDLVALVLGIGYLPSDVFYVLRSKTNSLTTKNLKIYSNIKDMILLMDKSFILSMMRPFLLYKLSPYFNKKDDKYYISKFIITVLNSSSYSEYEKTSKFFYNLEVFCSNRPSDYFYRALQFGWLIIGVFILSLIAPLGVMIALFVAFFKDLLLKVISKINPKLKMNLNFQIGSYAMSLAILSLVLASTIGLKDNLNLSYQNMRGVINSITVPASEGMKILSANLSNMTTDILGARDPDVDDFNFSDIDYSQGIGLLELKNFKEEKIENPEIKINNSSEKSKKEEELEIVVEKENLKTETKNSSEKQKKDYSSVVIDRNNTFWDYSIRIASECGLDVSSPAIKSILLSEIKSFIDNNRGELTSFFQTYGARLSAWDIAKRLPTINYNLSELRDNICKN